MRDIVEQHKVNITVMTIMTMMKTCMRACGLNSLANYFDVKTHDIWECDNKEPRLVGD